MKETIKSERNIAFSANAATESGEHLAEGTFDLKKTDTALASAGSHTMGYGGGDPTPMYMLLRYVSHGGENDIFRFPLVVGSCWEQKGFYHSEATISMEGYETVEISAGTFPSCLKHKTVFTDANVDDTNAELRNALINGTRYL